MPVNSAVAQTYTSRIALGQALFQDKNLSADRTVACASCHDPAHGFADPRAVAQGVHGQPGTRNVPSLLDINEYQSFFWDGRAATLAEQARVPFFSPVELGFSTDTQVLERVRANPSYVAAFHYLDGAGTSDLRLTEISRAIQIYEQSVGQEPAPFDSYRAGDKASLSEQARLGLSVFKGKAGCASCHRVGAQGALTDNQFHSSSVGLQALGQTLAALARAAARLSPVQRYAEIESNPQIAALGRYVVTLDPQDIGKFRTPSLRNVALTAPYMHDGSVTTLAQAIDIEIYYRGRESGHTVIVTPAEKRMLLAFLQSLSSSPDPSTNIGFGKVSERTTSGRIQPGTYSPTFSEPSGAQARRGP